MINEKTRIEPFVYKWKYLDGYVCLETAKGDFLLNDIGSSIWQHFNGFFTFGEIVKQIAEEEHEENLEEVRSILSEYIEELASNDLVLLREDELEEDW